MDFLNLPSVNRPMVAHTALGPQLGFLSLKGREGISELFEFDVELVSGTFMLDVRSMLGTELTTEIETSVGMPRYLSGKVTDFELIGREMPNSNYYLYKAKVRPALWELTQNKDSRIFQNQTIDEILKKVLEPYGFPVDFQLKESYRDWEYSVQYQESDFDFISRLMEHEGMYYYFTHDEGQHVMVITDSVDAHAPFPAYDQFTFFDEQGNLASDSENVSIWGHKASMTPSKYSVVDYDFRKPNVKLDSLKKEILKGDAPKSQIYEWQGGYQELDDAEQYAHLRLQELKAQQEMISAETTVRGAAPGCIFNLRNHPRFNENGEYLLVSAEYDMGVAGYSTGTNRKDHFNIKMHAIPSNVQFRAPRKTPEPKTLGPQTAKVVGPAGEEIYTDQYGRIKVQFHWDREGKNDENSSCWIRVSSPWAGSGFGGLHVPRIGDEVVIDFIGGSPDRPLVTGRVYNEMNMPPVDLPTDAHINGFRTRSVFGDAATENFLLFTDKLGEELIDMRAQMDMILNVLNDLDITVGNNRTEHIKNNLKTTIENTEERTVHSTRTTTINGLETGNFTASRVQTITGTQDTEVTSDDQLIVGGNQTTKIASNRNTTVQGEQSNTVEDAVTHTFNNGYTETVNAALADHTHTSGYQHTVSGGDWITNVTGETRFTSTGVMSVFSNSDINITAPASLIVLQATNVKSESSSTWWDTYKDKIIAGIFKHSEVAYSISLTGRSDSFTRISNSRTSKSTSKVGMSKSTVGSADSTVKTDTKMVNKSKTKYVKKVDKGSKKTDIYLQKLEQGNDRKWKLNGKEVGKAATIMFL